MNNEQQNPYATPEAEIESGGKDYFINPVKRASLTIKAFYAVIAIQTVYILVQLWRSTTYEEYLATESNYATLEKGDLIEMATAGTLLVATLCLVIFFLRWFHQCYKNLSSLEVGELDHTPGWAVGWFFVPFANLVKPYSVAHEMWHSSEIKGDDEDKDSNWVVISWWLFFLLSSFVDRYVLRKTNKAESLEDYLDIVPIDIASSLISIIGAILAINFVKRLSQRQAKRFESL